MATETGGLTDVVHASVDKVFEALLDIENYPQWQGFLLDCQVLERDAEGRGSVVRERVDAKVRTVEYTLRYSYDLPHSMSWDQISGDLKLNRGSCTVTPREDGSTDVTVDIAFEVGFYVPRPMKNLIRDQSLKTFIRGLKKRVES